jgi:uncharacterized protein YjbJ (UPF0337 family)
VYAFTDLRSVPTGLGNAWSHTTAFPILRDAVPVDCRASYKEQVMRMNKDQVKGRITEAKGKIKEVAGKVVGNETLQAKGKAQKVLGEAQAKLGDVKQGAKEKGA